MSTLAASASTTISLTAGQVVSISGWPGQAVASFGPGPLAGRIVAIPGSGATIGVFSADQTVYLTNQSGAVMTYTVGTPASSSGGGSWGQITGLIASQTDLQAVLAQKTWAGSGSPSAGFGSDGDYYVRTDKPFLGVVYAKSSGAWAAADNSYTIATLPAANSANAGLVITVTDACAWDTNATGNATALTYSPLLFECITPDNGATYYWVPVSRWWPLYTNMTDTGALGTGNGTSFTAINTFSLPNSPYVWVPRMEMELEMYGRGTGAVNSTKTMRISPNGGTSYMMAQALGSGTVHGSDRNIVYVGPSIGGQFNLANSSGNGGFLNSTTGAESTWSLTLQNLTMSFGYTINTAAMSTDTFNILRRVIALRYRC